MKKLLSYFGLVLKSEYDLLNSKNQKLENKIREKDSVLETLETFENFKPEVSYTEYIKQYSDGQPSQPFNSKLFQEFYDKYHRRQHQAFMIKKLAHKDPIMLDVFLHEFSNFDWEGICQYMKDVDWKWSGSDKTPTIPDLKNRVITLINYEFKPTSKIESGGFGLSLGYQENGKPFCKIEFNKVRI